MKTVIEWLRDVMTVQLYESCKGLKKAKIVVGLKKAQALAWVVWPLDLPYLLRNRVSDYYTPSA
jgi:hypothetical protein